MELMNEGLVVFDLEAASPEETVSKIAGVMEEQGRLNDRAHMCGCDKERGGSTDKHRISDRHAPCQISSCKGTVAGICKAERPGAVGG